MSKPKRVCQGCGKANSALYPMCNPCRQSSCQHDGDTHYDHNYALVCNCGFTIKASTRPQGKGKRAQWQTRAIAIR